ncbi:YiaA/YiaB family inner membrane protein [Microbacterium sp. GXF6406]
MLLSEKGFYLTVFLLGLFAAISVQKNVRDIAAHRDVYPDLHRRPERNEPPAPPQWTV